MYEQIDIFKHSYATNSNDVEREGGDIPPRETGGCQRERERERESSNIGPTNFDPT